MAAIPVLTSIAPLAPSADVWFLDIWGVLHNGRNPFHGAVAACIAFRKSGGKIILVSNSPRPKAGVVKQLDGIGVDHTAYDEVITSGDMSRSLIAAVSGAPVLHIGPKRDLILFEGLNVSFADADVAEIAVCTGLYDDEHETVANYSEVLGVLRANGVRMICANPDLKVERAGRIVFCAGAIAAAYEALGGSVSYAGKPYSPIYDAAMKIASRLAGHAAGKSRVLAIGDGVATDIRGAANAGFRAIYIASGVHMASGAKLEEVAETLFAGEKTKPIAVMPELVW